MEDGLKTKRKIIKKCVRGGGGEGRRRIQRQPRFPFGPRIKNGEQSASEQVQSANKCTTGCSRVGLFKKEVSPQGKLNTPNISQMKTDGACSTMFRYYYSIFNYRPFTLRSQDRL